MRKIKFRAWDREEKIMIDTFLNLTPQSDAQLIIMINVSKLLTHDLMQFTGLLDAKGKEIYESDIVQDKQKQWRGLVFWRQELPGFYLRKVADDRFTGNMEWIDLMSGGNVEIYNVIGNIYENPDLLEVAKSIEQ